MTATGFRKFEDPGVDGHWTLEGGRIHCFIVDAEGTDEWYWKAWHVGTDTFMEGEAPSRKVAEYLAKQSSIHLLSEALASSEWKVSEPVLVPKADRRPRIGKAKR